MKMISLHSSWQASKFYARVPEEDEEETINEKHEIQPRRQPKNRLLAFAAIVLLTFALTISTIHHWPARGICRNPSVRREWRTLSKSEQLEYIGAVSCLMRQPSIFNPGTSHYDDFVYTHIKAGSYSHYAAAFLAWHRLFVHNYEQALRSKCAFGGQLPYWDWTLDSEDLAASPVWDAVFGFGGDGYTHGEATSHDGRCVIDGPFANSIRAFSAKAEGHSHVSNEADLQPHCLGRSFRNDTLLTTIQSLVSPESVKKTLAQPDYNAFFQAFETGAHNAIPQFVSGDFLTFTAPNDPVFWLHHTQVDRLWWLWQQRDANSRLKQFHGPTQDFREGDNGESTLHDMLPMAGLSEDRSVEEVIDAQRGLLCYRY